MRFGFTGIRPGFIEEHLTPVLHNRGHSTGRYHCPTGFRTEADAIIHLAAIVGREKGELDPIQTAAINGGLTAYVAKHCAARGLRLIYVSSSEVYMPQNLYGLSKRWGEEACDLYRPPGLTILRLCMPYGTPGNDRSRVSQFCRKFVRGETVTVHEGATRSFCWIGDIAKGIVDLIENTESGVYNVGRDDDERTMLEVANLCNTATGGNGNIELVPIPSGFTPRKPIICAELRGLGWSPSIELEDGISRVADYLKSVR